MRLLPLLVASLVAVGTNAVLIAQSATPDQLVGAWRLDLAKSRYRPGPAPTSETRTYVRDGDNVLGVIQRVFPDGRRERIEYTANYDREYPVTGTEEYDHVVLKRIDRQTSEAVLSHAGRVFDHTGSGLLNVFGLVLANGSAGVGDSTGGCVRSSGSVLLQYATVTGCEAAVGGGVIASNLSLIHSTISGCSIHYEVGGSTAGAAAWAWGSTLLSYATITDNYSQLSGAGLYSVGSSARNERSSSSHLSCHRPSRFASGA